MLFNLYDKWDLTLKSGLPTSLWHSRQNVRGGWQYLERESIVCFGNVKPTSLSDEQQNIYFCFIFEADSPSSFHVA